MTDSTIVPISLSIKIGLGVLDGGSHEWLAKTHSVSIETIEQSWHLCREGLSRHFANAESREFKLLNDNELRERLDDALRVLIDWRSDALQQERIASMSAKKETSSEKDEQPEETDAPLDGDSSP